MNFRSIHRGRFKYELNGILAIYTGLKIKATVERFIYMREDGWIAIRPGYAWDGASGPGIDTVDILRASLVHDALYQLIREGKLDRKHRKTADQVLRRLCREDGMSWVRAAWIYAGVRVFGGLFSRRGGLRG